MTIQSINIENNSFNKPSKVSAYKPYLEENKKVHTTTRVKPLPGEGYLIHDNVISGIKYFFKDIGYDIKSIKNGYLGIANDHQLGRLNDVGLKIGGIGIAAYLASKTTNPKARLMEYIGLGTFLTSMSLYPKLFINKPAELIHGFDIDKEYIDDQGRKKSVFQDSNYIPYDLYRGDTEGENLDKIGDKMGIPRNVHNRHDIIKEQMRKIATQNNTLWMLTSGLATPAMTGLICYGLENAIAPGIEKSRNYKYNKLIREVFQKTENISIDISTIAENSLGGNIKKLLSKFKGENLPQNEIELLINMLTENLDENTATGIKTDVIKLLKTGANSTESVAINDEVANKIVADIKNVISKDKRNLLEQTIIPTKDELITIIKTVVKEENWQKGCINIDSVPEIKNAVKKLINSKIANYNGKIPKAFFTAERNVILESISHSLKSEKVSIITEDVIEKISSMAKIIGEFKENKLALDSCKSFKFEYAPETVLARYYDKFEKAFLKELGISFKDLKRMRESEDYTFQLLDSKISKLCQNEAHYKKALEKFGKIMGEMEIALHGSNELESSILQLINAIENNYNKTALRLTELDSASFSETIKHLIQEDARSAIKSITSKQELYDLLDGITQKNPLEYLHLDKPDLWENLPDITNEQREAYRKLREFLNTKYNQSLEWFLIDLKIKHNELPPSIKAEYIKYSSKGLGSSKYNEIARIIERYQGVKNSFNRILHSFEIYRRSLDPTKFSETLNGKNSQYIEEIIQKAKESLLKATVSEHTMKLGTINNPNFYKDLMNSIWETESEHFWSTKQKGNVTDAIREVFETQNSLKNGNLLDRFQYYISRFKKIVSNNPIDFTKPHHILNGYAADVYTQKSKTRGSIFNLIGQTPVDLAKGAANRNYGTKKWFRIIGTITGSVFAIALVSQLGFGKIRNPHNIKKQVNDDKN